MLKKICLGILCIWIFGFFCVLVVEHKQDKEIENWIESIDNGIDEVLKSNNDNNYKVNKIKKLLELLPNKIKEVSK